MKTAKNILYVFAIAMAIYTVISTIMDAISLFSYLSYYGAFEVISTILGSFFTTGATAAIVFGLGAICGYFEKQSDNQADEQVPYLNNEIQSNNNINNVKVDDQSPYSYYENQ